MSAAYLAKQGLKVLLLERRYIFGGAAVTEEIHPGTALSSMRLHPSYQCARLCQQLT